MKIVSWNVNGIRSVFRNGFLKWLVDNDPDIVCLQEVKTDSGQLSEEFSQIDGYWAYFNSSALKKGHSGVAVYTKIKPVSVETKLNIARFDDEGRCLKLTFKDFTLFNFYIPHGSRDKRDLPYKLEVYDQLFPRLQPTTGKGVVLAGDFNVAHTELDLCFPRQNQASTMFTQPERQQITNLLNLGYTDAFRTKYPAKKAYTWWPYGAGFRERDVGWRIDYFFVSPSLGELVEDVLVQKEVTGSDHAPLVMNVNKAVEMQERQIYERTAKQSSLF